MTHVDHVSCGWSKVRSHPALIGGVTINKSSRGLHMLSKFKRAIVCAATPLAIAAPVIVTAPAADAYAGTPRLRQPDRVPLCHQRHVSAPGCPALRDLCAPV